MSDATKKTGGEEFLEALHEAMRPAFEKPECNRGEPCACCDLLWFNERAQCGHWFCDICLGRGHDEECIACESANGGTP